MNNLITVKAFLFLIFASVNVNAKNVDVSPLDIVNARLEAHNRHDLSDFLATYSDDIRIYTYPEHQLGNTGKAHLANIFGPLFSNKSVHTTVHHQLVNGDYVVNHETVVREGKTTVYISIYEVQAGLIKSVRFIHQ